MSVSVDEECVPEQRGPQCSQSGFGSRSGFQASKYSRNVGRILGQVTAEMSGYAFEHQHRSQALPGAEVKKIGRNLLDLSQAAAGRTV